jgi:protein-S-isoprenylcysteine O-methyltransferase Ste14
MASIAILRWMSLAGIVFWLLAYWQGGKKAMIDIKESIRARNSRLDTALLIVLSLCSLVILALAFLTSFRLLKFLLPQSLVVTVTGTLLTILGIAGMFYCRHYLGRFWTAETNLGKDHQIIDTGPYRCVRHPIYTFAILMYIGFGMVFLSAWSVPFVMITVTAYILKARDEDAFLAGNLPGYQEYRSRVHYHLFPGVW